MNHCKFFGAIAIVLCTSPCFAGELKASDIEVVAVTPRSPDVKPYAMAVHADRQRPVMQASNEKEADLTKPALREDIAAAAPPERNIPAAAVRDAH